MAANSDTDSQVQNCFSYGCLAEVDECDWHAFSSDYNATLINFFDNLSYQKTRWIAPVPQ